MPEHLNSPHDDNTNSVTLPIDNSKPNLTVTTRAHGLEHIDKTLAMLSRSALLHAKL